MTIQKQLLRESIEVDRQTLILACEMIEALTGTCPIGQADFAAVFPGLDCERACHSGMPVECWCEYFLRKSRSDSERPVTREQLISWLTCRTKALQDIRRAEPDTASSKIAGQALTCGPANWKEVAHLR